MRYTLALLALVPALCAAQAPTPTPCTVQGVGSATTPWRQVRASGFTFCVPGDWRPGGGARESLDAPQWNGDGGSLTWNVAQSPAMSSACAFEARAQVVDRSARGSNPAPARPPEIKTSERFTHAPTTSITVDGVRLMIDQVECGGRWITTVLGTAPTVVINAVAATLQMAQLQLAVIHTIRFSAPAPRSDTTSIPSQNRALVALVDSFFEHPFRAQLQRAVIDSANRRADLSVALGPRLLPWTCYADTGSVIRALDGVLTVAYVAGDMEGQLRSGYGGDQPGAGVLGALQVYQTIQSNVLGYQVPELEAWKAFRDAAHLQKLVDSLARDSTARCTQQPPRFRGPVLLSPN